MPFTTAGRNGLLDSGKSAITHIGAFSDLGATELVGGSYARQAITWTGAASGVVDNTAQLSIPIPAGAGVQTLGFFGASSGGVSLGYWPIGSAGQLLKGVAVVSTTTDETLLSRGHGLSADDRVMVWPVAGEALPTGLSATTLYWVRSTGLTSDAFTLATTQGGSAVDITALGEAAWARTVPNVWASAGNLILAAGALDLDLTFA
ncbi:hypothetical protein [Spongiactinospora sp. TRM90649]|uniref:phage tail fiber protein n=1 Tax=Spongiactinospora sp. TRM90649 TaxID=3031114 RepID=UPI0023FA219A|nr:hypothetical protein [Spongiactinospora sp. TRM90649]MDF5758608.1 hypothetical protein [Spongiactinospora sp. TRM90649]